MFSRVVSVKFAFRSLRVAAGFDAEDNAADRLCWECWNV